MTVKEMLETMNYYAQLYGEGFTSLSVKMAGYNSIGERKYNISVEDFTFNIAEGRLTFWDR